MIIAQNTLFVKIKNFAFCFIVCYNLEKGGAIL